MIYKFIEKVENRDSYREGMYHGSRIDLKNGFIQFYSPEQIIKTAVSQFSGQKHLILIEVDEFEFGKWLKWEPWHDDELFPRLYQSMSRDKVVSEIGLFDDDETRTSFLRDYIFENYDNYPRRTKRR